MKRVAALATTALALTACGSAGGEAGDQQTITVAAAASLGESFEEIVEDFESENPDITVKATFAGSSNLAAQLDGGADFDVFASADVATMDKVTDLLEGEPEMFATNTLTIITEPGNPEGISSLAGLEDDSLDVVVCAPQVPCGDAAQQLTRDQDVTLSPASEESKVSDVLAKVRTGQADAGLVYVTDATGAGEDVHMVETEGADEAVNDYPIALLSQSQEPEAAQAFIDHVTGSAGQEVLREKGFGSP